MRPTLSDVARLAGVSVATASRALSNPDLVADGTRRAVRDAASSCGYRINLVARSLRIQRTDTLLVLTPDIESPFCATLLQGIEETAFDMGYSVMVGFTSRSERRSESYAELLSNGRVDGMLVLDGGTGVSRFTGPKPEVPVVQLLDRVYEPPVPVVRVDDGAVAELAVRHLAGLGHRRIAHIAGPSTAPHAIARRDGFISAMGRVGLPVEDGYVQPGEGQWERASRAMEQLLALPQAPTAVYCADDGMACAAMTVCRARGMRIPEDISFVGTNDMAESQRALPQLSTVRVPNASLGARATELLVAMIRGQQGFAADTVLPVELLARTSCAPVRTAVAA
jgi:LacI family repressor for deo operon, udp, cdd, tsx, nupC, and nupG